MQRAFNRTTLLRACLVLFSIWLVQLEAHGQERVEQVAQLLSEHKFKKVHRLFELQLAKQVKCKQLKLIWEQTEATFGEFQNYSDPSVQEIQGQQLEMAYLHFEQNSFRLKISESEGELTGILIEPLAYQTPDYGKNLVLNRQQLTVQTDTFQMSGELVVPNGCTNCPVVVLVHGSGPSDRNETIGPNKVFYDLTLGLAAHGVATFRYDKRTNIYPEVLQEQFDIYDETIDDALSAIALMQADTLFGFSKIVALGHSLGGYAMPLIADSSSDLDGAILFSANARRLETLIPDQIRYIASLDGTISKEEQQALDQAELRRQVIENNNFSSETPASDLMVYWPGQFWAGISQYEPVETAARLEVPLLILQGEKDYQITMEDFELWQNEFEESDRVELISYPNLSHLFTPVKGEFSKPMDYFKPSNVDEQVIKDIAIWVKSL